ncbi:MAG: class I SAM-dependent methyltransferase [Candidatus Tectimicrobiota bacterium]
MARYSGGLWQHVQRWWRREEALPAIGQVRFGSFARLQPIGAVFGLQRGHDLELCIDRHYISHFLARHAADIRGHVLEVADDLYTQRFGGSKVVQAEILHAPPGHPEATLVADLTRADHLPSEMFDCIILTQTLQYIYEVGVAIRTLHRLLRPGGVLLLSCPGISQMSPQDRTQWGEYWRFTTMSLSRLLTEHFPADQVQVQGYGNVLTATAFLHGLLRTELPPAALEYHDPDYELLITGRARKPDGLG